MSDGLRTPPADKASAILRLLVSLLNAVELHRPDSKDTLRRMAAATDQADWTTLEREAMALRSELFGEFPELGYLPSQEEVEGLMGLVKDLLRGVAEGGGPEGHNQHVKELRETLRLGMKSGEFSVIRRKVEDLLEAQADFRHSLIAEKNELRSIVVMMAERMATFSGVSDHYDQELAGYLTQVDAASKLTDLHEIKDRIKAGTEKMRDENRNVGERVAIIQTELVASRERIRILEKDLEEKVKEAIQDRLTGAYNRRAFDQRMSEMAHRNQRYGVPFSLILFDIDKFKRLNDAYGHQAGDLALIKVVRKAAENLRDLDFLARYGGEEFAVVLEGTDLAHARTVAEKVRTALADREYTFRKDVVKITVSLGVAQWAGAGDRLAAMIARADAALYAAKEGGRNRTVTESELPPDAIARANAVRDADPGASNSQLLETRV